MHVGADCLPVNLRILYCSPFGSKYRYRYLLLTACLASDLKYRYLKAMPM